MAESPAQSAAADLLAEAEQFTDPGEEEVVEASDEDEQQQEEVEIPEISWEAPEDIQAMLDTPDFEDEDEEEEVVEVTNYEVDEYEDPEKQQLAKKLKKMQKQLAWQKDQQVKQGRKLWADEARKYFQFSAPETIQATSRRAFLKEAQRQHDAVAKVAKPIFDNLNEQRKKMKEEALVEARAEAEKRWGRPTTGPTSVQVMETTQSVARERLASSRGLKDVLKEKLKSGEVKL